METVQGGVPPYGVKETLVVNGGGKLIIPQLKAITVPNHLLK